MPEAFRSPANKLQVQFKSPAVYTRGRKEDVVKMKTLALLSLLVTSAMVSALPAQGDFMEPFSDANYHIQGLAPRGWQRASAGVFSRNVGQVSSPLLVEQSVPVPANLLTASLTGQLGVQTFPESSGTLQSDHLKWTLYNATSVNTPGGKAAAAIAIAEEAGTSYFVMLTAPSADIATLRDQVFTPAVKALAPLTGNVTTAAAPPASANEREVSFSAGGDTIFGTLLLPANATKVPAVVLLSGSGPTDRDGNSQLLPGRVDSHLRLARILGDQGVASLRFDKLGTGKTGLASYASHPGDADFNVYINEAKAALNYLKNRPEVDSSRIMILGHSEGGMIALVVAADRNNSVKAAVLINGLSRPYLETIRDQVEDGVSAAVRLGQMSATNGDQLLRLTDSINDSLLQNGTLPSNFQIPQLLQQIYNPASVKFLATVARYDPRQLASSLPKTFPVLVTCGEKDIQVPCSDVQNVLNGFKQAGNDHVTAVTLKNANHVMQVVEGEGKGMADYTNPALPFSDQMKQALIDFVKKNL